MLRTFDPALPRFTGAMHTHTQRSDGSLRPETMFRLYRDAGFDFVAVTDHHIWWDSAVADCDGFITLPGMEIGFEWGNELSTDYDCRGVCYHLNIYADPDAPEHLPHDFRWLVSDFGGRLTPSSPGTNGRYTVNFRRPGADGFTIYDAVRETVRYFRERGCIIMLNHPDWSRELPEDVTEDFGCFAMEIFNSGAEHNGTGYADALYNEALRAGLPLCCMATDDLHGRGHVITGRIVVAAERLERNAIMRAVKAGSFYSTTGPEIRDFYVEGDHVYAETSPVREISFITYEPRGASFLAAPGAYLHRADAPLSKDTSLVRLQITDRDGRIAWSNPIYLNK